jgi:hypothetical protein
MRRNEMATSTPWGAAQYSKKYTRGIVFYGTAGHGGFHVSKTLNQKIDPSWREETKRGDGWYEEDCDWAIVAYTFPELFNDKEKASALSTLKNWRPYEYEGITGETLAAGESHIKDEHIFLKAHENDYLVRAAWGDWHDQVPKGQIAVLATLGGKRGSVSEQKFFLVPFEEYYDRGVYSFVIDPSRHQEIAPLR